MSKNFLKNSLLSCFTVSRKRRGILFARGDDMTLEKATLGGGCFWCLEAIYQQLKGVTEVVSGYAGGRVENPSYLQVCDGLTGHAEVIQITFDPEVISYRDILNIFFTIHDPTTLNRQGNDVGPQYRSVIFYHSDQQKKTAKEVIAAMGNVWSAPIVTELVPFEGFFPAEDYHRGFYQQNPDQGYCIYIIEPKLDKFRKMFASRLKE